MGSWNKTCGLSNLHIYGDTPCYMVVLVENIYKTNRCYTDSLWRPVGLPILCKYDDYGAAYDLEEDFMDVVLNGIEPHLALEPIEIDKPMDQQIFFSTVHRGGLYVREVNYDTRSYVNAQVDFILIKKSVVDNVLENYIDKLYIGNHKGTVGYKNSYVPYSHAIKKAEIPETIATAYELLSSEIGKMKLCGPLPDDRFSRFYPKDNDTTRYAGKAIINYLSSTSRNAFVNLDEILMHLITMGDSEKITRFMERIILAESIEYFMNATRKIWTPACYDGYQSAETAAYRVLANTILEEINKEDEDLA